MLAFRKRSSSWNALVQQANGTYFYDWPTPGAGYADRATR